ncbi:MAG: hotdog fold thioesterase [Myxococcota bacterium]
MAKSVKENSQGSKKSDKRGVAKERKKAAAVDGSDEPKALKRHKKSKAPPESEVSGAPKAVKKALKRRSSRDTEEVWAPDGQENLDDLELAEVPEESKTLERREKPEAVEKSEEEARDELELSEMSDRRKAKRADKARARDEAAAAKGSKKSRATHEHEAFEEYLQTAYQQSVMHELGIQVKQTGQGMVELTLPVGERFHQVTGVVHGGIHLLLAESAASILTSLHLDLRTHCALAMQVSANHIRPARGGLLRAVPALLHQGRGTCVCNVDIFDEESKLVSTARVTLLVRPLGEKGQYEADFENARWTRRAEFESARERRPDRFAARGSSDRFRGPRDDRGPRRDSFRRSEESPWRGGDRSPRRGPPDRFGSSRRDDRPMRRDAFDRSRGSSRHGGERSPRRGPSDRFESSRHDDRPMRRESEGRFGPGRRGNGRSHRGDRRDRK